MGAVGGGTLCVSKVPHTPNREGPAIRDGLWGPPFLCAGALFVCAVAGGVFGLWLMVSWDSYVLLLNGGCAGWCALVAALERSPLGVVVGVVGGGYRQRPYT